MILPKRIFMYLYCFIFALVIPAYSQKDFDLHKLTSIDDKKILSIVRWGVSGADLVCTVSKTSSNEQGSLSTKALKVSRKKGSSEQEIFTFETPDSLVNMYPLGELDARLLSTWTGGSAYHIRAFSYRDGEIRQVLDASSRGMPEIIIGSDEQERILITHMGIKDGQWSRNSDSLTDVYRFDGTIYKKIGSVPWEKRFMCLSAESCVLLH